MRRLRQAEGESGRVELSRVEPSRRRAAGESSDGDACSPMLQRVSTAHDEGEQDEPNATAAAAEGGGRRAGLTSRSTALHSRDAHLPEAAFTHQWSGLHCQSLDWWSAAAAAAEG